MYNASVVLFYIHMRFVFRIYIWISNRETIKLTFGDSSVSTGKDEKKWTVSARALDRGTRRNRPTFKAEALIESIHMGEDIVEVIQPEIILVMLLIYLPENPCDAINLYYLVILVMLFIYITW